MAYDSDRISLDISAGVATVQMVRHEKMNALDEAQHAAMRHVLSDIGGDKSVRAVILTGSANAFCAGQDLGERASAFFDGGHPDLGASLEMNYNPLVRTLADLRVPVVAAVNGMAFGAGASLAIACDIVLAAQGARFQFGFINVGLGPDSGASYSLPRLVGHSRAMDLALTGRAVDAAEAAAMGLVSRVVPDENLMDVAFDIASGIAARSPDAVAAIKRQFRTAPDGILNDALDAERDAQRALGETEYYRQAVQKFANRQR